MIVLITSGITDLNATSKDKKKALEDQIVKMDGLQKVLVQIANSKDSTKLEELETLVPKTSLFMNDLPLLKEILEGKQQFRGERTILLSNTDNPYDLLLCGTEVAGSCQDINKSSNMNRGLLGYLLNGHRMIEGKPLSKTPDQEAIDGRAIFRLELDEDDRPVLLLERLYPLNLDPAYKDALKIFAKEEADRLSQFVEGGIPLVSVEEGDKTKPYGKQIRSLGGRVDEYVDSADGIATGAVYTLRDAYYVF